MGRKKKKRNTVYDTGKIPDCQFIAYTDGGCAFNPGGPGGYGAVVANTYTGEVRELSAGYFATTNNRMELMAAITALEAVPNGGTVMVYADSQYVLGILTETYSPAKNTDLVHRLKKAATGKRVATRWVPGHSGVYLNERCDELATEAMQAPTYTDDGYYAPPQKLQTPSAKSGALGAGGAMAVQIQVPDGMERFFAGEEERKVRKVLYRNLRRGKISFILYSEGKKKICLVFRTH